MGRKSIKKFVAHTLRKYLYKAYFEAKKPLNSFPLNLKFKI